MSTILDAAAVARALSIRDLTDPSQGPHAMQLLLDAIVAELSGSWRIPAQVRRAPAVVSIAENYDHLHYPEDGAARDARYTRYASPTTVLRTQTTAMVPPLLRELAQRDLDDILLVCPGLVYRRDCIDRLHTGEPHQVDLWRIKRGALCVADLEAMAALVVRATMPAAPHRLLTARHPYTTNGRQIDIEHGGEWIEIGECGLALPQLLDECGLPRSRYSGLAMGLGLDRLLMLRKGINDIRLLRCADPRVTGQMQDLSPYREVSRYPEVRRDLSVVVAADADSEQLGDRAREALADRASMVETVAVLSETRYDAMPPAAVARLRLRPDQKNVLLRVVLRDLTRTLTHEEANGLRDTIYEAVHEGAASEWAAR